jgi:exopolyphosphatase/pppGpp-phosphohydrolase
MPPETTLSDGRIVGFMDIGTNAVRLLLVAKTRRRRTQRNGK